jgi:O-antigen biosynthesis protein
MKPSIGLLDLDSAVLKKGIEALNRLRRAWKVYQESGWRGVKWEVQRRLGDRGRGDYSKWVRKYDTLTPEIRTRIEERLASMEDLPLISVLMPTYNPNPVWLREAIESVRGQIYPRWEICIADDASPSAEVREILKTYSETDARIKVVFRPENGHISAASNSALALASGQWLALMDHDDLLPAHALFWVADCIAAHPDVQLIYSDEDKIDEDGVRSGPYFKPDWNLDLFRSQNMFSHLGVLSTALVRAVGGFRLGLEGSQDWDLVLRCVERVEPFQIRHVPRVLYHWRVHMESTAQSMNAKPYAALAGERALKEHFERSGIRATTEHVGFGYRVRYALPEKPPLVSLIIAARNDEKLVRRCVDSIRKKTTYANYEIVLIDNNSDDPATRDYLAAIAKVSGFSVLRSDEELSAAALANLAVGAANGELIALLKSDLEVITPDWLSEMVSVALQPNVGAVGARLWDSHMRLRHAGMILGLGGGIAASSHLGMPAGKHGYGGRAALMQSFSVLSAACVVVRKPLYEQMHGLDEAHFNQAFCDLDFCLRLREAGFRNVWTPHAELFHHELDERDCGGSAQHKKRVLQEAARLRERWGEALLQDPAYSPNLTLMRNDFSFAWPPRVEPV